MGERIQERSPDAPQGEPLPSLLRRAIDGARKLYKQAIDGSHKLHEQWKIPLELRGVLTPEMVDDILDTFREDLARDSLYGTGGAHRCAPRHEKMLVGILEMHYPRLVEPGSLRRQQIIA